MKNHGQCLERIQKERVVLERDHYLINAILRRYLKYRSIMFKVSQYI